MDVFALADDSFFFLAEWSWPVLQTSAFFSCLLFHPGTGFPD
jgi:hypothetical protein